MFYLYANFFITLLREAFSSMIFILPFGLIVVCCLFSYFRRMGKL